MCDTNVNVFFYNLKIVFYASLIDTPKIIKNDMQCHDEQQQQENDNAFSSKQVLCNIINTLARVVHIGVCGGLQHVKKNDNITVMYSMFF